MNKKELLQYINKDSSRETSIKFPRGIDFEENNNIITINMRDGITKNMQDDSAAFEGWALCIKACMDTQACKCCLKWEKSADPKWDKSKKLHYQRFLYRVNKFENIFGGSTGWFFIHEECKAFMNDFEIKGDKEYYLNSPSTTDNDRINYKTENEESRLENEIIIQQDNLSDLKKLCPAKLQRQLPVGLFREKVKTANAIFPHKHSAIDLWGVNGDDLYIIELKAAANYKVGVLSELFFYTMVLKDEQDEKFIRESEKGEKIKNTKRIKAIIMAPKRHSFITQGVFDLLNENLKNRIEFWCIKFTYDKAETRIKFKSFEREIYYEPNNS